MRNSKILIYICFLCLTGVMSAQVENNNTIVDWRQHNLNKYNRMLVNPTYSIVREGGKAISFWSRIQWTGVNNSPQTFLINYSGKIGESSGGGLGLYQQNLGLLVDSGLLMNYAYQVQFGRRTHLTLGINSTLFRRGLNKNAVSSSEPDPAILENQDDFLWLFMPGINLSVGGFDLGFYAENLFDYNLNESRSVTGFDSKIYSGQLGVTHVFKNSYGLLQNAVWRSLTYVKTQPNNNTQYGGSTMIDLPRYGWLQMGYNNTYGVNGALGIKLGDGISVGVIYETGTTLSNQNFGPTYEAMATVELGFRKPQKQFAAAVKENETEDQVAENDTKNTSDKNQTDAGNSVAQEKTVASGGTAYAVVGGSKKEEDSTTEAIQKENSKGEKQDVRSPNREGIAEKEKENTEVALNRIVEDMEKDDLALQIDQKASGEINNENNDHPASNISETPAIENITPDPYEADLYASASDDEMAVDISQEEELLEETLLKVEDENNPVVTREVFGETSSYKTISAAAGVEKGFYLVVNVFSKEHYFKDFILELKENGFEPQSFVNPKNNYWYVYLAYADNYYRVKQMQRSHLDGAYHKDKWVLWVK